MNDRMDRLPGAASWPGVSAGRAVLVGHLVCSLPSTALFALGVWFSRIFTQPLAIQYLPLIAGIVAGWAWWLISIPRWRRWALQHGAPEDRLRTLARRTFLTWPSNASDRARGPRG